ncbi:FAD-dependent oxidoreductase [Vitreoscilla stercoraria]|uniref:FAD-binding protein n=1 Tax=Vitreoscilla stercoraria TaxID=61 RepID=A0ABY4EEJ8_VITST|nr:FAD-dependent oxidoreductase [Vitreoscilla stercoraria]UOO93619.1 FAD-binding protein [Vitreoscilla stercoraria]
MEHKTVDLLVIGAGAAGMTAALTGRMEGLDVLLCEKQTQVGGLTATSGGTTWVPGTHLSVKAGVPDKVEDARTFLKAVMGERGGEHLREAFLRSGPAMVSELDSKTEVKFAAALAHPDYIKNQPGEAYGGRALAPVAFDARVLGEDFDRVLPPRPEFMGLGGMMVNRNELTALLRPVSSFGNAKTTFKVVVPYLKDRLKYKRGTRLVMGNALVGRLLYSLKKYQTEIWYESPLKELLMENGKVVGALMDTQDGIQRVMARKGVVLATGGVAWNQKLRQKYFPIGTRDYSLAPKSNTGDGVSHGLSMGAQLDNETHPVLWFPCSTLQKANGQLAVWPHLILDRSKPGLIAVNASGKRFVNETDSYHDFCIGQLAANEKTPSLPAYLVCDDDFIHQYGLGLVMPGAKKLNAYLKQGYLVQAPTIRQLAEKINVDASELEQSVIRNNAYSITGLDEEFGRGMGKMNRFNGDEKMKPNPCIGPILRAPFYALAVKPIDCASSVGLAGDEFGRVLNEQGHVITGLYACGNDLASIFKGIYPGPGTTIGPGMVFGWRIAKHAAGTLTA